MDLREQATRLRKAVESSASGRGRRTFDPVLQRQLRDYFRVREAQGANAEVVGRELGLSPGTLRRWRHLDSVQIPPAPSAPNPPAFVPVTVTPIEASKPSSLSLVGPHGVRVEGLNLETLVELLRRLS
jgi:hypothetical protein